MTSLRNTGAVLLGAVLLLGVGPAAAAEAPVDSPQEWTQYRLTPEKNLVIETDDSVVPAEGGFRLPDEVRATPVVVVVVVGEPIMSKFRYSATFPSAAASLVLRSAT